MPVFTKRSTMPVPREELYAWHARPGAFSRLAPPFEPVGVASWKGGEATAALPPAQQWGDLSDGAEIVLRMKQGPLSMSWLARHSEHIEGRQFVDTQVSGPFKAWRHTHRFHEGADEHSSVLDDSIEYALPLGPLGALVGGAFVRRKLERMFAFRHERTRTDLERHAVFADKPRLRVAVSGASGLVGQELVGYLRTGGHTVLPMVRRPPEAGSDQVQWSAREGTIDAEALEGVDAVVHLAGESISGRWTEDKKRRIMESRVQGTTLLARTLAGLSKKPEVLICASAIGFYGDRGEDLLDEDSGPGSGFLVDVVREWEDSTRLAREAGIRVVNLRLGIVLDPRGGALSQLLLPFKLGLGGPVGTGRQYMSWVALDDVVGLVEYILYTRVLIGPVNAVAPEGPVTNAEFGRVLGRVLGRPAVVPLPAFAVRAAMGEMGQALLLDGQRVAPRRALDGGFTFRHPRLREALAGMLGRGSLPGP